MTKRTKPNFTPELRLECTQLVVDNKYFIIEAAQMMNVGKSSLDKWVRQLKKALVISRGQRNTVFNCSSSSIS